MASKKIAVVTGSNKGIGFAIVKQLWVSLAIWFKKRDLSLHHLLPIAALLFLIFM